MVYKLTDENGQTYGGTQWGPGVSHSGTGKGELCGSGYVHYYAHPLLAVFLNPIHANFKKPRLWEAQASGKTLDDRGLKGGSVTLTVLREIKLSVVTTEQCVAFGILCALEVCKNRAWRKWAHSWLSGEDRSSAAAEAAWAARAAEAARDAAEAARDAAWAAEAAWAAARAAWAAARAARAARTAEAARDAADAADAAAESSRATAPAADAADAAADKPIDLIKIAKKAFQCKTTAPASKP